jgi:hypothetical protein
MFSVFQDNTVLFSFIKVISEVDFATHTLMAGCFRVHMRVSVFFVDRIMPFHVLRQDVSSSDQTIC